MAFDEALAERIRSHLDDHPAIVEKKMFGGLAFILNGNMAVGVSHDELIVRVGEDGHDEALAQPGVRIFDLRESE
jgi:TfoX/Sxy family transcriptional regulator of competence genes